ncbi:Hsp20/alpha crystallin family protein [Pedobacter boryungensis]|uniref:Hsp20/alpha crystallin family protein n=1 Tax=Pedobacter boryungensis TaxID=869962 RepID=A0ABX2DBE1_9SPHI|nr:Hsp20/alpha crystallin family protein [Pedobacter boryungensis]NQX30499.1 Hsp20/alpha crystallin family protein [Pedobacter boryungensis]
MTLVKFNSDKSNNNQRGLVPTFGDVFDSIFTDNFFTRADMSLVPAVNICETTDHYHVELAAPGLSKEDFKINLERKMLTISVQREQSNEQEDKNYSRKEFSYNSFTRSFTLPDSADENNIVAKYNNGVLSVDIPKREEAKHVSRQISIS